MRRVMVLEWINPQYTAGHWVPDMVQAAGGINLISKSGERSRRTCIDEIVKANPDIISPVSIIGGQSDKDRQNSIDDFQDGKSNLMIAGLRAGNVGINLSRARYVVFAELDWSPAIHRQAEDRLHRLGQKNTVFAYYLVGDGTLDNHVADILVDKGFEIDSIMDGNVDRNDDGEKARRIMEQIQERLQASGTNVEE